MPNKAGSGLSTSKAAVRRTLMNLCRERAQLLEEIQQLKAAVEMYREVNKKLEMRTD